MPIPATSDRLRAGRWQLSVRLGADSGPPGAEVVKVVRSSRAAQSGPHATGPGPLGLPCGIPIPDLGFLRVASRLAGKGPANSHWDLDRAFFYCYLRVAGPAAQTSRLNDRGVALKLQLLFDLRGASALTSSAYLPFPRSPR